MASVKTTIDAREVEVERDCWALDVARELGIDIPTLCQHPAVEPYGACRLCVVEVTKGKWTWLTTSCDLPIREGLTIRTDTESVKTARKMAAELLWSSAPDSEVIAELAHGLGVEKPRFANHDERGKCILCGLCVRVCQKVIGESAVCFAQRGSARRLSTPLEGSPETCIGCGACVNVCPTGYIQSIDDGPMRRIGEIKAELEMVPCEDCGKMLAPAKQIECTREKLPEETTVANVCPACRRRRSAKQLNEGLAAAAAGAKKRASAK